MVKKNRHAVVLGRRGGKAGKGKTSEAKAAAARANGEKGGRPPGLRSRIAKIYSESYDGGRQWFIDLKPGWIVADERTHGIVETRKADALDKLNLTERCECDECRQMLAKETK